VQTLRESSARTLDSKKYKDVYEDYRNAYDELAKRLVGIHNKFIDMEDAENIIILADDKIEFDKIIQAMDVSREAGFWNIQLAKLGG
jgi:biopolymer transport protein ExbD